MNYTIEQLIDALQREYEYLCHDDFDPDVDLSLEEHLDTSPIMPYAGSEHKFRHLSKN